MADFEHARSLLRLARRDLNAMIGMQDSPLVDDEIIGFHAQQAVEKALKSWISAMGLVYPLTHQLPRLLTLLEDAGAGVQPFLHLTRLTPYAVQVRYEEVPPDVAAPLDRAGTIADVTALLDQVAAIVAQLEA
jgi:hypothetical protein